MTGGFDEAYNRLAPVFGLRPDRALMRTEALRGALERSCRDQGVVPMRWQLLLTRNLGDVTHASQARLRRYEGRHSPM